MNERASAGFTLIEVLVALLVLSLGLLGLAALQAATVQFNTSAYQRSQATSLAYDMADRLRTNRRAALDGAYAAASAFAPASDCGALGGGGTVADQDIVAWRNALACALPLGNGRITFLGGGVVTISVTWDDGRSGAADELFEMTTGL